MKVIVLRNLFVITFLACLNFLEAQSILIDESFDDWNNHLVFVDDSGDGASNGLDFESLYVTSDEKYLYVSFTVGKEILLQDYSGLSLAIDIDDDISTGEAINGVGADLVYEFSNDGKRELFFDGWNYFIDHEDIALIALPTVSSDQFELKIARAMNAGGNEVIMGNQIRLVLRDNFFDKLPNEDGGISYTMENIAFESNFSFEKEEESDIRIMSLNVRQDGYFESGSREAINRILQAVNPDVIAFQEIYDHTDAETEIQVASALNFPSAALHSAKIFPDIILVSKFPIEDVATTNGSGNGAFKINDGNREWLIINAHLPCCDNNDGRDEEVAEILSFIEEVKLGTANIDLAPNSPIIILGDMNFVGPNSQPNAFVFGIDDGPDWGGKMEDAKPQATGEPAMFTWYNEFSNFAPGRLDYVFYSGSVLKKKNSFSVFTPSIRQDILQQYNLEFDDSIAATDHLAVVVDFDRQQVSANHETSLIKPRINLYPNPTNDLINFDSSISDVRVIDALGRVVLSLKGSVTHLDVSKLASGNYRILAKAKGKKITSLFVKK